MLQIDHRWVQWKKVDSKKQESTLQNVLLEDANAYLQACIFNHSNLPLKSRLAVYLAYSATELPAHCQG